jgi:hypothetical protein
MFQPLGPSRATINVTLQLEDFHLYALTFKE